MQRGEGSITTDRRTGRLRARVCVDGKRITIPGSFDDEKQARGAIAHFWKLRAAEQPASSTGLLTVAEWGDTYLDQRETDGHHRAVDRDRARWRARIAKSSIASEYIDTLTAREIRAWVAEQIRTPTQTRSGKPNASGKRPAKQTVVNALNLLRVALEEAVQAGHIESNPARDVRVPRMAREDEGWDWLRASELEALFALTGLTGAQRRIFTFAVFTGLRKGELWGLRRVDVDLDRAELVVSKSYNGPTKGGLVRRVPLLAPALEAVRTQMDVGPKCSLVFPSHDSSMRSRNDSAGWEEVRVDVSTRDVRFHDLRHTCASHLLQGSWAPQFMDRALRLEEVQKWLGHKSIRTTERYAHLSPDAILGRVKRIGREPESEAERRGREWTLMDTTVPDNVVQLAKFITKSEAPTGFEPVYDGFANRTAAPVVSHTLADSRPLGDRILRLLTMYAGKERPTDRQVVEALAEALAVIQAPVAQSRAARS